MALHSVKYQWVTAISRQEKSVLDAILNNRLLLAAIILVLLLLVPGILMWGRQLRDYSRPDRRKHARFKDDRRA